MGKNNFLPKCLFLLKKYFWTMLIFFILGGCMGGFWKLWKIPYFFDTFPNWFKSSDENFCFARLCCIDCRNSSKSDGTISVQEMVSKMELDHHQKVELLRKLEKKEKRGFKKIRKSKKDSPKEQTLLKKLNVDSVESPCNKVIS